MKTSVIATEIAIVGCITENILNSKVSDGSEWRVSCIFSPSTEVNGFVTRVFTRHDASYLFLA